MFLATERACGSKKHTARITMISLGGCPGHLRGWNGTTRRTEALTDTSRRQGTGRHPIPGCRSNCARRPDGLDGERARPRGHAAAEQRLTRPGPGGNPVCSSRARVLVSTAYLRARPQKVAGKTRTHLARVCAPSLQQLLSVPALDYGEVMSKATAWQARASAARSPGMVLCCTAAGMLCAVALLINILRFFHLTGGN